MNKLTTTSRIALVCSARQRATTQNSSHPKGSQWWGRDVYHAALADDKSQTLCGRDSSEWLTINADANSDDMQRALDDFHFCTRCRNKLMDIENQKPDAYLEGIMAKGEESDEDDEPSLEDFLDRLKNSSDPAEQKAYKVFLSIQNHHHFYRAFHDVDDYKVIELIEQWIAVERDEA